jgi:hypothetical protein
VTQSLQKIEYNYELANIGNNSYFLSLPAATNRWYIVLYVDSDNEQVICLDDYKKTNGYIE